MSKESQKPSGKPGRSEIGGGPPPPTDDRSYDHPVGKPWAKGKPSKSSALDMTASPGLDEREKER
jgi:hypothetical protein